MEELITKGEGITKTPQTPLPTQKVKHINTYPNHVHLKKEGGRKKEGRRKNKER